MGNQGASGEMTWQGHAWWLAACSMSEDITRHQVLDGETDIEEGPMLGLNEAHATVCVRHIYHRPA